MESEIWKDVVGYEGFYQVSNLGRVKSLTRVITRCDGKIYPIKEKTLKATLDKHGYMTVGLYKNGVKKTRKVHQLVAMAFLNHKPCGFEKVINHINNDKTNNNVNNLELVSSRYNSSVDQWRHNRTSKYAGVDLNGQYKDSSPRWRARIHINKKRKHIGYFRSEDEAGKAYQEALNHIN